MTLKVVASMSNLDHLGVGLPAEYHQMPGSTPDLDRRTSPLVRGDRSSLPGASPLVVSERILGHLILRGSPETLAGAVADCLGLALPIAPLTSSVNDAAGVRWVGPDEWLVTLALTALAQFEFDLRMACGGQIALVDVSGGQTLLLIQGECATQVMMKSTSYDVGLRNLPPGKVVSTTFAQAEVMVRRVNENAFELILRRSFSDYLWAWLRDAASEFGFAVQQDG